MIPFSHSHRWSATSPTVLRRRSHHSTHEQQQEEREKRGERAEQYIAFSFLPLLSAYAILHLLQRPSSSPSPLAVPPPSKSQIVHARRRVRLSLTLSFLHFTRSFDAPAVISNTRKPSTTPQATTKAMTAVRRPLAAHGVEPQTASTVEMRVARDSRTTTREGSGGWPGRTRRIWGIGTSL